MAHAPKSAPKASPQPLAGRRILVSRARQQAGVLSEGLRKLGAEVREIPFIEIRPPESYAAMDSILRRLQDYDWLILTSVNGVDALFQRLGKLGMSEADLLHLDIAAIGPATRKAIEEHGLPVDVVPEEYVAEAVVAALWQQVRGTRVLLIRAKVARDVIPNQLREAGAKVHVVEAYETVVPETSRQLLLAALKDAGERPHVITFTSSSTARNFVELLGQEQARPGSPLLAGVKLASIGPVTSATMRELGLRPDIEAQEFTVPGLIEAIAASS